MSLLPPVTPVSKVSPMMSEADGVWNMGESPDGRDVGGVLGQDPLLAPMPTYVPLLPTAGWDTLGTTPPLVHYVGSFRPPGVLGPNEESRASFHVVAPDTIDTPQVVVAIFTLATFGGTNPQNPHAYPGDPSYYDLLVTGGFGPHVTVVKRNLDLSPVPPYRVIGVQFVPRTSQRPMVSAMQRLRQVRKAVLHLLLQRYSIQPENVAFAVDCASFGGFTAQVALSFYPTEFHAGVAGAFSGAHRSMPSDFDSHVFSSSLLGSDLAPHSYLMRDTVEIPMWCHIEQTDFASVSTTNRWFLGHMQRPIYFLVGDEDTVTHGTDWIQILAGSTAQLHQTEHGWNQQRQNVLGRDVDILWSVVSKSGHGEHRPNVYTLEGVTPPIQTNDLSKPLEVMLDKAHAELNRTGPGVVAIDHVLFGRKLTATNLPSLDPSRAALAHKPAGARTYGPGTLPGLLTENVAFERYGDGTWLGANESLKVKKLDGHTRASVFVGSAEGYVTRLMMEDRGSPVIKPLVVQARSNMSGTPYALGHGTWGLDVGEVDDTIPGDEVVVTSYNRVALFSADTLNFIREVTLPNWEYDNPRKVQIADLFDSGGGAIVFRTLHGHLVIMDKTLAIRYEHDEGGVIDLVVGPEPAQPIGTWLKRPIYILSARGHIVRLEIDKAHVQQPPPAPNAWGRLAGASHLEYGGMRDLDVMPWLGQDRLAALFVPQLGTTDAVRFFATTDCSKVGQFGDLTQNPPPPPPPPAVPLPPMSAAHVSPFGNQEPSFTYAKGHGGDRYVISSGGDVSVWDGEMVLGHKSLGSFRPALTHGCVQAGDIDPDSTGDEVVVSTAGGRVVWFKLSDLTTSSTIITGPDFVRSNAGHFFTDPTSGRVFENRCNMSLGATWAMAAEVTTGSTPGKLRVIDPTGAWWEVTPAGAPTLVREGFGMRSLIDAKASSLPTATGGTAARTWETAMAGNTGALFSTPYVPQYTDFPAMPWYLPSGLLRAFVLFQDGHWMLPSGGTRIFDSGTNRHWCAWWHRYGNYPNLIQCASYTVTGGMVDASSISIWGSTQDALPGNVPPPRWPMSANGYLPPLRTETELVDTHSLQSIKIGRVLSGQSVPQVIATAMGGRVMALDGNDGKILAESADYGLGGMALAVADLNNDGLDEILFAPIYSPIAPTGGTVRSHLHVFTGASGALTELSVVPVGEPGNDDFLGYGACGIAVADLPGQSISKAIFVTTLNGELVVFGHTSGVINQVLFRTVVEGSMGAFNSIVIDNLEPDVNSKPEVYIAGSYGIRRFDFQ